jgi:hypothetical protein
VHPFSRWDKPSALSGVFISDNFLVKIDQAFKWPILIFKTLVEISRSKGPSFSDNEQGASCLFWKEAAHKQGDDGE